MALTFPVAPANGATHVVGTITWTYSSATGAWTAATASASSSTTDVRIQAAALAPTTRSDATPLADGDLWYDTTANKLMNRETSAWVAVGGLDPRFQAAALAPTTRADLAALVDGDTWYDTTANQLMVRETGVWKAVSLWTVQAGGISRADRIKVGAATAPLSAVDILGTTSREPVVTTGEMNLLLGDRFSITPAAATTFTFTNIPAGRAVEVWLKITNGGTQTITWTIPGIVWETGTTPTLATAGTDIIVLSTQDGGVTWFGHIMSTNAAASASTSGSDYQVFTASGTWTKPTGLSTNASVRVQIWGAGGSGGKGDSGGLFGGGGGGGAYTEFTVLASSLPATAAVVVGNGGASRTTNTTAGLDGGNSSFNGVVAYGGKGGTAIGGGLGGGQFGSTASGNQLWDGGEGGTGAVAGSSSTYGGGGGGTTQGSIPGSSKLGGSGGAALTAGNIPGGGGGGAKHVGGTVSGAGARGEVRVWVIG